MNGGYDEGYQACPCFWGKSPGRLVEEFVANGLSVEGMTVLDAGCGEGKNAHFLASRGANVLAIDMSDAAITNAVSWCESDNISWIVGDIETYPLESDAFELVVAYGLFHCLPSQAKILETIQRLKSSTRPAGYNIVCTFNSRFQDLSGHSESFAPCLIAHDEYLKSYIDWEIVTISDEDLREKHPHNNIWHTHSMTRLVARKPSEL